MDASRRRFLGQAGLGALASLVGAEGVLAAPPQRDSLPHFRPTAKRVIRLFLAGGPSQMDTLDYKPGMEAMFDKDLPDSVRMGQRLTTMTSKAKRHPVAPSVFKFGQHGASGTWVSEVLPHHAGVVDEIALIRSMHTEEINHGPGMSTMFTGHPVPGKASLGSWVSFGMGSENGNLPAFVVMTPTWSGPLDDVALQNRLWGSGFLPGEYDGVALRRGGDPVLFLRNPAGMDAATRRRMLDLLGELNERQYQKLGDPETRTRIAQYEMAFKMQSSVPDLLDLSGEPKFILEMYGPEVRKSGTFAHSCILARRMIERGVRFVQILHRGWDHHVSVPKDLPKQCRDIDQPSAALVLDLKQRGLLDETLVVSGGEFGRTIYCQGKLTRKSYGRDHHPRCFTTWLAGGGIKGGVVHGKTDDFSYNVVENPVHIHDLNATILHCLGIDHRRLSFRFQGLDQRLTGVDGKAKVVRQILA